MQKPRKENHSQLKSLKCILQSVWTAERNLTLNPTLCGQLGVAVNDTKQNLLLLIAVPQTPALGSEKSDL